MKACRQLLLSPLPLSVVYFLLSWSTSQIHHWPFAKKDLALLQAEKKVLKCKNCNNILGKRTKICQKWKHTTLLLLVWIFMHEWKKSEKLQSFEQFMGYLRPFLLRPCVVVTQKCIALEFEIRLLLSFRHKTSKKITKKKFIEYQIVSFSFWGE